MSESYDVACEVRAAIDGVRDQLADLWIVLKDLTFCAVAFLRNATPMGTYAWKELDAVRAKYEPRLPKTQEVSNESLPH